MRAYTYFISGIIYIIFFIIMSEEIIQNVFHYYCTDSFQTVIMMILKSVILKAGLSVITPR